MANATCSNKVKLSCPLLIKGVKLVKPATTSVFLTSNWTYSEDPESSRCELKSVASSCWPIPNWNPLSLPIIIFSVQWCLEDIKLFMRKTMDRFSDLNSFHKGLNPLYLRFKMSEMKSSSSNTLNGAERQWPNESAFQLCNLTVLGIYTQPLPIRSARLVVNSLQLRWDRLFSIIIPKIKKIEQSCIRK